MYADEDYQRRITYGTPENIKIRRFYNQLNNRPLNYGMEDLFPETPINTMTPLPYNRNTGNYSSPANNNTWQQSSPQPMSDLTQRAQQVRYPDFSMRQLQNIVRYENGSVTNKKALIDYLPQAAIPYNLVMTGADYFHYNPLAMHDKFKHAAMNCNAAQRGSWGNRIVSPLSEVKEWYDIASDGNTPYESDEDMSANLIGRYLGNRYPNYDCENMLSHYISRKYPKR